MNISTREKKEMIIQCIVGMMVDAEFLNEIKEKVAIRYR
jgi:hypothetical protein